MVNNAVPKAITRKEIENESITDENLKVSGNV